MKITIEAVVKAPLARVWESWTTPADIMAWNAASDDWHTTASTVDLRNGGAFSSRMEAKDGSYGFDFEAVYLEINHEQNFTYEFGGRLATVVFKEADGQTEVTVTFDPETENSVELQREGWQSILDNFRTYCEKL